MGTLTKEQIEEQRARAAAILNASRNGAHGDEDAGLILDDIRATITRYVALPSPGAADAVTLWVTGTHAQSVWEHASRLVVKSPLRGCGKTRLLEVISGLVHKPLLTSNVSAAALVRSISEDDPPALILDEADAIFSKRRGERTESAEDLRGILNAGHSRGWPYIRWNASTRQAEHCPTFAMAAIASIGDLPDTIEHRSVIIEMQRRAPGEVIAPFRRRLLPELHVLRDRLHSWITNQLPELEAADPTLPVEDRPADVWAPLVAIADLASGDWPQRARRACREMCAAGVDPDATAAERLLVDLQAVFGIRDRMPTAEILTALAKIEESPWGDWYDHPIRARELAGLLRPYKVRSRDLRLPGVDKVVKGYLRSDLEPVWDRYSRTPGATSATARQGADFVSENDVADQESGAATEALHPSDANFVSEDDEPESVCSGVADVAEVRPEGASNPGMGEGDPEVEDEGTGDDTDPEVRHPEAFAMAERLGFPAITMRDPVKPQIIRIGIAAGRDNWATQLGYIDEATTKDIMAELEAAAL